jgi:hypothetical protein
MVTSDELMKTTTHVCNASSKHNYIGTPVNNRMLPIRLNSNGAGLQLIISLSLKTFLAFGQRQSYSKSSLFKKKTDSSGTGRVERSRQTANRTPPRNLRRTHPIKMFRHFGSFLKGKKNLAPFTTRGKRISS